MDWLDWLPRLYIITMCVLYMGPDRCLNMPHRAVAGRIKQVGHHNMIENDIPVDAHSVESVDHTQAIIYAF